MTHPSVFQSTHPRRVRHPLQRPNKTSVRFQSTHPRRVRPQVTNQDALIPFVSIHAPTQGATSKEIWDKLNDDVSIHAPTQGATQQRLINEQESKFQSTHPRRVRLMILATSIRSASFNPRTHAGCDPDNIKLSQRTYVSIHAPTQGATDS